MLATILFEPDRLAVAVATRIHAAIGQNGCATLALSGGKSPTPFLQALAAQPLEWPKVDITLVDERWVPPEHPDSNSGLIKEHLLSRGASAARFHPLYAAVLEPCEYLAELNAGAGLAAQGELDVVVLGMGEDGHTASWFPDAAELTEALTSIQPYTYLAETANRQARMTLTLSAVAKARWVALAVAGEAKIAQLTRARRDGVASGLPVAHVLALPQMEVFAG
jgi:6-phosphogluconolactonase